MTAQLMSRERLEEIVSDQMINHGSEFAMLARMALAAMDSEPVEMPLDYLQGHKDGLEWAARLAEANHPDTGDWLYDCPIELAKAIRKGPDMPPAQPVADSEPVAWTDEEELRDVNVAGIGYLFGIDREANKFADPRRQIMLYRHAQPAPVVVPEGLNPETTDLVLRFASALADKLYKAEQKYGRSTDWMKDDWYDDCLQSLWEHIEKGDPRDVAAYCAFMWYHGWVTTDYDRNVQNACRAAMLESAPHDTPALNSLQIVDSVAGKWIPVSERMPDDDDFVYIWPRPDFGVELHVGQYCECSPKGDGWYAQVYEQNYGIEWYPITVTHWMPLPAAPQEVKSES